MTARSCASALCAVAMLACGCAQTVAGSAVRPAPAVDEDSRSPVDVDTVLLDRAQMRAITGAVEDLTPVPGMQTKVPVDIAFLLESVPQQCQWVFADSQVFGSDVEEFAKTTYQSPRRGGLISQAAAGYRDPETARRAFDGLVSRIHGCDESRTGRPLVGEVTGTAESVHTRPGDCGRDYQLKSVVLVEVTFCGFPDSVPEIVLTNIVANVPG